MPRVLITNESRVPLPAGPYPPPGDTVPLSFFDTFWIILSPVQRLFLYPDAAIPFSSIVDSLRSSLSRTLSLFHPFGGKLIYLPGSGDAVIDCSAATADGVAFVEAESDLDIRRLAGDEVHDCESFLQLVPDLQAAELPAPVLVVQVTAFAGGGVAVGLAAHHVLTDGKGLWLFLEAWAATCKGDSAPPVPVPSHDRAVIRHAGGPEIARQFLRQLAPALPKVALLGSSIQDRLRLTRITFALDGATIQSLKQRAVHQSIELSHEPIPTPSTFTVITAHAWLCFSQAKAVAADEVILLGFMADCRARIDPPLDEGYTGNCIRTCFAKATGSELAGTGGLANACAAIGRAIKAGVEEPLRDCEGWVDCVRGLPPGRIMHSSSSPRFKVYEMDFGWGRPERVELVSMNHDGELVLAAGKEQGTVQASMGLAAHQMEVFAKGFVGGLEG
ncbi:malonyl-coenzyme A:anthocyanin 3-O-glucoside-6''-O-malonyltransferase-like isoform X2 [Elaeis guineensis]